jgi:hypothetical protein
VVELARETDGFGTVAALIGGDLGLCDVVQALQLGWCQPTAQAPRHLALHHAPRFKHVGGVFQIGYRHPCAPVVPQLDHLRSFDPEHFSSVVKARVL